MNKMRKVRYYLAMGILLSLVSACHSKNNDAATENDPSTLHTIENVTHIIGIGKIQPLNGVVALASNVSGIVESVRKHTGDSVKKGEVIITLKQVAEKLKKQQILDKMEVQKRQIAVKRSAIAEYLAQLSSKEKNLNTSEKLLKSGAETAQNVANLKTESTVLQSKVSASIKDVSLAVAQLNELKTQLSLAEQDIEDRTIRAPADGVLLTMDAQVGGAVQALSPVAQFIKDEPLVVKGEVDEMFANQLKLGQEANIHFIGKDKTISTGKIIQLSSGLSNKSLFTDVPGEQQDRRVRQFKIKLDSANQLLVNTKVACEINLNKEKK